MQQVSKSLLKIIPIPILQDNYAYFVCRQNDTRGFLVDPAEPEKICKFLKKQPNLQVTHVLYTHHHYDHAGMSIQMKEVLEKLYQKKDFEFISSAIDRPKIQHVTKELSLQQQTTKVNSMDVKSMLVPCHTRGSLLYYVDSEVQDDTVKEEMGEEGKYPYFLCKKILFTGDTLFIGGCGLFFEGNAKQMYQNFQLIKSLPKDCKVFCGHEYTLENYEWSSKVDYQNEKLQQKLLEARQLTKEHRYTIPSTVQNEIDTNIFMRCDSPFLQEKLKNTNPEEIMAIIREMYNNDQTLIK